MNSSIETWIPPLHVRALAQLTRGYPLLSGCGSVAKISLLKSLAEGAPAPSVMRAHGLKLIAPIDDEVGRSIFYTGDYDRKISWVVSRLLKRGDTAVDVGANYGLVSTLMGKRVGKTGRVHAFEPNPIVADMLAATLDANNLDQVTLHRMGVGDAPGQLELKVPRNVSGGASFVDSPRWDPSELDTHTVPVEPLDTVLAETDRIKLLKIDVEGFEMSVLQGARRLIQDHKAQAVLFEEHRTPFGADMPETLSFMLDHGYALYGIPRCLVQMKLLPLEEARRTQTKTRDYVALAPGDVSKRLRVALGLPRN